MAENPNIVFNSGDLPSLFCLIAGTGDLYSGTTASQNYSSLLEDGARGTVEQIFDSLNNPCMPVRSLVIFKQGFSL